MKIFSLRTSLIVPYVTLVILLAIAIGVLSYQAGSHAVSTVSRHLLEETVNRIGQAIDRHVVGSVATLEAAFPNGMQAPEKIEDDLNNIRTRFWIATTLHIDPNNYVYYGNLAGQAIGLYRYSYEVGELRIKYQAEEHRKRYRIDSINASPVYKSTEKALFDPRQRPWFQAAQSSSRDIWTSVYIDFGTQDLVATRARRVVDHQGILQGVVATDMPLRALNDFIGNLDISPHGIAFIIEPDGQLIASSCSPNVRQIGDGKNVRINAASSGNKLLTEIYQQIQPLLAKPSDKKIETTVFQSSSGEKVNVAFAVFQDHAGLRWINVVALPDRDFMGGISDNVMRTIFLAVLATVVVVFIGLSILNWVSTDLKRLSKAANQIGSGQLEAPLDIVRNDEIGVLAKSFQEMRSRLQTDHLTGLPNRYAFEQRLNRSILRHAEGELDGFAVMFIDLNDFKRINDRFGHDIGDQALIEFSQRLKSNICQTDMVARFAGDEFVLLLEKSGTEELENATIEIERICSLPLQATAPDKVRLGAAIGIARFPKDANSAKDLLILADNKMYRHKTAGKATSALNQLKKSRQD